MNKHIIDFNTLRGLAYAMAEEIRRSGIQQPAQPLKVHPVPRNGIPAALSLAQHLDIVLVDDPHSADIIVDDLIDSGATRDRYPDKPFYALIDKRSWHYGDAWVVWPWEGDAAGGIEDNIRRLLQYVGEDPTRGGLHETPIRLSLIHI